MKKIGLLGYGYTARYFAALLVRAGYDVWGTSRHLAVSPGTAGVTIVDFTLDDIAQQLPNTSGFLISVPPTGSEIDPTLALLKDLMMANKHACQWIGYLSSTGVYGDHQGQWVDETSTCYPTTVRAHNRLLAENAWLSLWETVALPVMIFRLSGIYGPGRSVLDRLRGGKHTSVIKAGQYFSRIHVFDICQVLYQSLLSPMPGEIFNVADDFPCSSHEVDKFAAQLLQLEPPQPVPYEQAMLSPMAKEFYASNRRVSNAKLKRKLLPLLKYPSYQEGLQAILSGEDFSQLTP